MELTNSFQIPVGPAGVLVVQLSKKVAKDGITANPTAVRIPVEINPLLDVAMLNY